MPAVILLHAAGPVCTSASMAEVCSMHSATALSSCAKRRISPFFGWSFKIRVQRGHNLATYQHDHEMESTVPRQQYCGCSARWMARRRCPQYRRVNANRFVVEGRENWPSALFFAFPLLLFFCLSACVYTASVFLEGCADVATTNSTMHFIEQILVCATVNAKSSA